MKKVSLCFMAVIASFCLCSCSSDDNEYAGNMGGDEEHNPSSSSVTGSINGFNYIDLGITRKDVYGSDCANPDKRIVFAECNVGAENETDCGYCFRWGEQNGWKDGVQQPRLGTADINISLGDSQSEWKPCKSDNLIDFQGKINLDCDGQVYGDAATYNMGAEWKMMDNTLIKALDITHGYGDFTIGSVSLNSSWTTRKGVGGVLVKNPKLQTEVFFPAPDHGILIWSTTPGYYVNNAYYMLFLEPGYFTAAVLPTLDTYSTVRAISEI